jgi:predicted DNA-binding transcriptional regulator AlpA
VNILRLSAKETPVTELQESLRLRKVLSVTGYSRATLYRRIAEGKFPQPRKDGHISYWPANDVAAWQARRHA